MFQQQENDARFGPKVGQIGTKWDKCGTFEDNISEHFCSLGLIFTDQVGLRKAHRDKTMKNLGLISLHQNVLT